MVSNLVVEIAIYNFDIFHTALMYIDITHLMTNPVMNCENTEEIIIMNNK